MSEDISNVTGMAYRQNNLYSDPPPSNMHMSASAAPRYQVINPEYRRQQLPDGHASAVLSITSNGTDSQCQQANRNADGRHPHCAVTEQSRQQTNMESREVPHSPSLTSSQSAHTTNYPMQVNHQTEINANSISTQRPAYSQHASTLPVSNNMSDYTITELPRIGGQSLGHEQLFMMDNSVVSGYNNNGSSCDTPPSLPMTTSAILACVPTDFNQPRPRRGRRDRQRRRRHRRRSRHHGHRRSGNHGDDESYNKPDCCSVLGCKTCLASCLEFKKVLVFFASFGIICVLVGIVLGVLRSPGNNFFALSLSFVAMGLILLTMVLVGWKCIPVGHQPCYSIFGLGNYCSRSRRNRRRRQRHSWLGRRMNPEFRYRPPPPSYASAMQEHRNEQRHIDLTSMPYVPGSPPPSYKSHTTIERPGIHIIFPRDDQSPTSNPPTYRLTNQRCRPSLAILNDFNVPADAQVMPSRFSVSSTAALVESEERDESMTTNGVVNMSFSSANHTVDMGDSEPDPVRSVEADVAAQTDNMVANLPRSVAIILEDGYSSTL